MTDAEALQRLVERLAGKSYIAVDTEFMRERTYYARLCLLQIATDDLVAVVDPLAVDDLSPLYPVLFDEGTTKVFHAAYQDLEIVFQMTGRAPSPVFDTQVAATLAGHASQTSYGALVRDILGEDLKKADSYTDWARRPLTDSQLRYAADDVRYLTRVYMHLAEELERKGRADWLAGDFERLADPATYTVVPEEQYRRVKRASSLNRRQLAVLREVAAWREVAAQRRDLPKRWVAGDESLVEIARRQPSSAEELSHIRGLSDRVISRDSRALLEAIERGRALAESDLPSHRTRKPRPDSAEGVVDLMSAVVRVRAKEHRVAAPLLASREDLEALASGDEDSPLLSGWRARLVGDDLAALLDGRLTVRVEGGRLRLEPVPE